MKTPSYTAGIGEADSISLHIRGMQKAQKTAESRCQDPKSAHICETATMHNLPLSKEKISCATASAQPRAGHHWPILSPRPNNSRTRPFYQPVRMVVFGWVGGASHSAATGPLEISSRFKLADSACWKLKYMTPTTRKPAGWELGAAAST